VLHLAAAGRIDGRVIAEPAAHGVYVLAYAQDWAEAPGSRRMAVAGDGTFTVTGVPGRINLVAYAPGRRPSAFWKGDVPPGRSARAELVLGGAAVSRPLRLVIGDRVAPPAGTPILYATGTAAWSGAVTDASGLAVLGFLQPDSDVRVLVYAVRDADGLALSLRTAATLGPGAWSAGSPATLSLPPAAGGRLALVDAEGNALRGLHVVLASGAEEPGRPATAATTDEAGGIDLARLSPLLPAGPLRVLSVSQRELWRGEPPGPSRRARVTVRNLRWITLRLVDRDRRPVSAPWIAASVVDGSQERDLDAARDPHFLDLSPPAWFRFRQGPLLTLCYDPAKVRDPLVRIKVRGVESLFAAAAASETTDVMPGSGSGALRARAVDGAGRRVPTVVYLVHTIEQAARYPAKLPAAGDRELVGLAPGRYRWRARHTNSTAWEKEGEVQVLAGRTAPFVIRW
jgi:hypothetical protein